MEVRFRFLQVNGAILMFCLRSLICVLCLTQLPNCLMADKGVLDEDSKRPHVVMLVAEREYATMRSLKEFAQEHDKTCRATIVAEDPDDRNSLVGLECLQNADLLLVSVRRRTLPDEQLDQIRKFVASGKPVIGIRTASHAFSLRNRQPPDGSAVWQDFDQMVFGGNYTNHHGNDLQVELSAVETGSNHPIMKGINSSRRYLSSSSLYRVSPLLAKTEVLMRGRVKGHASEPVAWTFRRADGGKSFYTSLGNTEDFKGDVLPLLLVNAISWCLN